MSLIVRPARQEDAPSIAAIRHAAYLTKPGHATAYGTLPLADHMRLETVNTQIFIAASSALRAQILVVEDPATGQVISTAKWFLPVPEGERALELDRLPKVNPEDRYLNHTLLEAYMRAIAEKEMNGQEDRRCY
ncbi:MAG: hypothetical protein Q9187_009139, partial [Circinaria calcarea]